jgi:hypothetical protein
MGKYLYLDEIIAGNPVAENELAGLLAELAAERAEYEAYRETSVVEADYLRAELEKIKQEIGTNTRQQVINALKLTYRKHCLADDSIGWIELEDILRDALCEAIGDKAFQDFLGEVED